MIIALGAVSFAMLALAAAVAWHGASVQRLTSELKDHTAQLAKFGRAVYGSSGTPGELAAVTMADPDAAARLAARDAAQGRRIP